jgi:hypothetical protein
LPHFRGQSQLGEVYDHMGQQRKKGMGVGTKSRIEMDPRRRMCPIFGHLNRLLTPRGGKLRQVNALLEREVDCLGTLQPFPYGQNHGCKQSLVRINVVPGGLLESKPKDVQPNQRCGLQLHMGGKATNTRAKVKWDSLTLPLSNAPTPNMIGKPYNVFGKNGGRWTTSPLHGLSSCWSKPCLNVKTTPPPRHPRLPRQGLFVH